MSGPKVVRIVTREERIAIAEAQLAALDAALDEWERIGLRNGTVTGDEVRAGKSRVDRVRKLLAAEEFASLQSEAATEISFLRSDTQSRLQDAVIAAAAKRRSARRRADAARSIRAEALKGDVPIDPADLELLARADPDDQRLEGAVARVLRDISARKPLEGGTADLQRLAALHSEGEIRKTFLEWRSEASADDATDTDARVGKLLSELAMLEEGQPLIPEFEARVRALEAVESSGRRVQILDSLLLDLKAAVAESRALSDQRRQVVELLNRLGKAGGPECLQVAEDLRALLRESRIPNWDSLRERATSLLSERLSKAAQEARRRVVLRGLEALGYTVRDGMETAWIENGRVVVKKSSQLSYGVELAGSSERLQVRAVAIDNGDLRTAREDERAETEWCADLASLMKLAKDEGTELIIEKAMPVGAMRLKQVPSEEGAPQGTAKERTRKI